MRRIWMLLLTITILLTGCAAEPAQPISPMDEWAQAANLAAEETPEALYAAALSEDTLIVYSTSTRMMEVAKSFEKQYPGLTVQVEDIRENEMYDMLRESFDNGEYNVDVVCSADGRGIMVNEFLPKGIVFKYTPYDIADKILPGNNEELLMLIGEASVLYYNDAHYETAPISNWWELTEERWRGKVYMPNPARSVTTFGFVSMFIQNSAIIADAYTELYGVPLEIPAGETAGHVFIRMLMNNDVIIVNSSDEVSEAIAAPGSRSDNLGIMVTSKLRLRDIGYELVVADSMVPFDGLYSPVNVMVAGGAKNINAAKLFIRWIYGETDGQGEGYKPYLQNGAWSLRSDVEDESAIAMDSLNLWTMDRTYLYENKDDILAFWEELVQSTK